MFEKPEKTPAFPQKNCSRPSLEAVMALQKMFEEGRLEELHEASESAEAPPLEVRSPLTRGKPERSFDDGAQGWTVRGFFRNLAESLELIPRRKQPIGGRSASGNG
jgi:hypothetical protein